MDEFEVVGKYPANIAKGGLELMFSERLLVKRKSPKWKNFGPAIMGPAFLDSWERFGKNFTVYEDDVFLGGFQRCGTSLLQEVTWLVMNNFDFEAAKNKDPYNRAQWFE
jgi:Sulfotransferase domain